MFSHQDVVDCLSTLILNNELYSPPHKLCRKARGINHENEAVSIDYDNSVISCKSD